MQNLVSSKWKGAFCATRADWRAAGDQSLLYLALDNGGFSKQILQAHALCPDRPCQRMERQNESLSRRRGAVICNFEP